MRGEKVYPGMRIGLLGGSFNPAHDGHRHISLIALKRLQLDRVWWLVSPQNPLKQSAGMARLELRISEARRIADHPRIVVSDIESRLGTVYTRDTLARLQIMWPGVQLVWLMGADNLLQLPRWHNWTWIVENLPIAVLDRPGQGLRPLNGKAAIRYAGARVPDRSAVDLASALPPAWTFIACRRHSASATAIRAARNVEMSLR